MIYALVAVVLLMAGALAYLAHKQHRFEKHASESIRLPVPKKDADQTARSRIAEAISAHALYEQEHSTRSVRRGHGHGRYDSDQAVVAIYQRVVRLYHHAKQIPPDGLLGMVKDALEGSE